MPNDSLHKTAMKLALLCHELQQRLSQTSEALLQRQLEEEVAEQRIDLVCPIYLIAGTVSSCGRQRAWRDTAVIAACSLTQSAVWWNVAEQDQAPDWDVLPVRLMRDPVTGIVIFIDVLLRVNQGQGVCWHCYSAAASSLPT
jgi:hypothetical protein